jgi:hypothetical protein
VIGSPEDLTDQQRKTLALVKRKWESAEKLHAQYRPKWEVFYGLSRNYRRLQTARSQASTPRDQDTVMDLFRRVFGTELFIPYVFTVIETNVPRILASGPRMNVLPLDHQAEESCPRLRHLYKRDADLIDYDTTLQEVARSGLRYGLGVMKTFWEEQWALKPTVETKYLGLSSKVVTKRTCSHAGPQAEAVDIFDFRWDPAAKNIATSSYVIHRTWRSFEYIKEMVEAGRKRQAKGDTGGWFDLDLDKVKGMSSDRRRSDVMAGRMQAAGMDQFDSSMTDGEHEVWECHDGGTKVYTVLDQQLLVQDASNPYNHCEIPFQIYRPTLMEHEFVGIGEVEPLAHLQYELNMMRGQRRDAATLALNAGYFYQVGSLDPSKLVTGPGVFNPVFGNPSESIQQMPFRDIPQSGVSEEQALKGDIELTSGLSESSMGTGGEETATGTQLVQAAANLRVKQKTKNLSKQLIAPAGRQWDSLYEQHILDEKTDSRSVRVEDGKDRSELGGYNFIKVSPEDARANVEIVPDESSMEPDDPQQKRNDARELVTSLAPFAEVLDLPVVLKYVLTQYGIEAPEDWIKSQTPPPAQDPAQIVSAIGAALQQAGVEPELVEEAMQRALQQLADAAPSESSPPEEPKSAPEPAAPVPAGG